MRLLFVASVILASLFPSVEAAVHQGSCEFPVPNFQVHEFASGGLTKAQFHAVMDRMEQAYAPIFQRKGARFKLHRSWSNGMVNAQAWCEGSRLPNCAGGTCNVEMFGGLARVRGMTANGLALVGGHEIGHCLAGAPFHINSNMSAEGQSDWYSTAIAMPRMGLGSKRAAQVVSDVFAGFEGNGPTSLPGPYLPPSASTYLAHPAAQCRRVTYEAGRQRACRPNCWFAGACYVDNYVDSPITQN